MNSIAQIRTFPTGTNATGIAGKIIKVGQFYSGDGQYGAWSFQDIELQDETGKIVVCLDKRPELAPDWNGASVEFIPGQHQGKPCGVIAEDHQPKARQGQTPQPYRRVRVTPSATMAERQGGAPAPEPKRTAYDSAQEAQGRPPAQSRAQAPQTRQQPQQAPQQHNHGEQRQTRQQPQQQAAGGLNEARRTLAKISTLYGLCYDAAVSQAWQIFERHGYAIMPGAVGIMADKLLMETIRRVSVDELPLSNPAALKGRPLSELMPFLEEALDANLARRVHVEQAAKEPQQQQPAPRQPAPRQQAPEPEPQHEPEQRRPAADEDSLPAWREGMEEDDIPF